MRLIDADALIEDLLYDVELDEKALADMDFVGNRREIVQFDKDCKQNNIEMLRRAPTIEIDTSNRNVGKWISCSERLPNENDYNPCMECLDGAVWYFTENGVMGLGYYYESTKEWATIGELSTDGKVIAWMPIPESYRPKEE